MPRLTYEQLLAELQALVGKRVIVSVASIDEPHPFPAVSLAGELRKAEPSRALQVLQGLGGSPPDDEALFFHVGGGDEPAERTGFALLRSRFRDAEKSLGAYGEQGLSFESSGVRVVVVSVEEVETHLPPPRSDS